MPTTTTHTITGMSCEHCVASVRAEVSRLAGVTDVDVDLATGRVVVTADGPVDEQAFADAIDEAGYEVAP